MDAERSINLFESTLDVIDAMDGETVKRFLKAIRDYAFDGIEPSKSDMVIYIPWRMIKFSLDRHNEIIDSKRVAGRKSGESRRAKSNTREQNGTEDNSVQLCSNTSEQKRTKTNKREQTRTHSKSVQLCSTEKESESKIESEIESERRNTKNEKETYISGTVSDFDPKSETSRGSSSDTAKINDLIKQFSQDDEKINQALHEFVRMRSRNHKPLTAYAMNLALKKLAELSPYRGEQLSIINQAVEKAWMSFYPLKDKPEQRKETEAERIERIMRNMGQLGENEHL